MDFTPTILIIDDEKDFVSIIKRRLEKKGYRVLTAHNGKLGLEVLKNFKPDLIVLDINMPVMGGIEFYRHICDKRAMPKYPVLILTARSELEKFFDEINAEAFMAKPFEIDRLYEKIQEILKKRNKLSDSDRGIKLKANKKVLIVDDDAKMRGEIVLRFLNADYLVQTANTGIAALEKIAEVVPDLLVVKLRLPDIPGDIVVAKVRRITQVAKVPVVLYDPKLSDLDYSLEQKISSAIKIDKIILSSDPEEILQAADLILRAKEG